MLIIDASSGNCLPTEVLTSQSTHQELLKKCNGPIFDMILAFCADMTAKENFEYLSIFIDIISNVYR